MIEFKISAPGILMLTGEYAEMYDKNVVITTLNQRTTLQFTEIIHNLRSICQIEFPDVGLSLNLPLELVESFLSSYNIIGLNTERLFKYIQYFITSNGMWNTHEQRVSLRMFFFLLFYIVHREQLDIRSFRVHVTTEIPLHANLGSSTSFAVCLAACFLHWSRRQRGDHQFNRNDFEEIATASVFSKKAVDNAKCLMDTHVCCVGYIARRYQLYNPESPESPESPENNISDVIMTDVKILLIDSTCRLDKNKTIEHVARLKHLHPEYTNLALHAIDRMSKSVSAELEGIFLNALFNIFGLQLQYFEALQKTVRLNQRALVMLNLSNQIRRDISNIAYAHGCRFGGKLTGVGEKKFVYILLRPDTAEQIISNIPARLEAQGFPIIVTFLGCEGVKIEQ